MYLNRSLRLKYDETRLYSFFLKKRRKRNAISSFSDWKSWGNEEMEENADIITNIEEFISNWNTKKKND